VGFSAAMAVGPAAISKAAISAANTFDMCFLRLD
jgi:hypothetical protein